MTPASARTALADTILSSALPEGSIRQGVEQIHQDVLAHSPYIRQPDFTAIHPRDLEFLFDAYDQKFFSALCRQALGERRISFRLSRRMTRSGGTTTRSATRAGMVAYEIAVASGMLFDSFNSTGRGITVGGLECENRLQALQRILEHEMVHLAELVCWESSDCAAPRFHDIARRLFLHRAHTHNLITRREIAAESGIRASSWVSFEFEGRRLIGRVNRITRRATVLVPDAAGRLFSDGLRYRIYYVPLSSLHLCDAVVAAAGGNLQTEPRQ